MIGALPLSKHGVIRLSKHMIKGGPQQARTHGQWQQVYVNSNDDEVGGYEFDIADYPYPDFPAGCHWVSKSWDLNKRIGEGLESDIDYSGGDPIGVNPDGSWQATVETSEPWQLADYIWGKGPNASYTGQLQNKILLTGPVKGTIIKYEDWVTGMASVNPAPRGCTPYLTDPWNLYPPFRDPYLERLPPSPPSISPSIVSMEYKTLAKDEQFELVTDHLSTALESYAITIFRYGVRPFPCITSISPDVISESTYTTFVIKGFNLAEGFTLSIGGVDITSATERISTSELFVDSWNAGTLPGSFGGTSYDVVYTPPSTPTGYYPACTISGGLQITL